MVLSVPSIDMKIFVRGYRLLLAASYILYNRSTNVKPKKKRKELKSVNFW